jgi:hypothetical protein
MVCVGGVASFLALYVGVEDKQIETMHQIYLRCAAASIYYVILTIEESPL